MLDSGFRRAQFGVIALARTAVLGGLLAVASATPAPHPSSACSRPACPEPSAPAVDTRRTLDQALEDYPAAAIAPGSEKDWPILSRWWRGGPPDDEAAGRMSTLGVELFGTSPERFASAKEDLFKDMDRVVMADGVAGPMNFAPARKGDPNDPAQLAIEGRNSWILWTAGDEAFWDWMQQYGYGIADFLILLDSRGRDHRFRDGGMINQPGMKTRKTPIPKLGLYLDEADATSSAEPKVVPANPLRMPEFFKVDEKAMDLYTTAIGSLAEDGVDPRVYGYPSGVVGLRLFPNPDFFGDSDGARNAREYWNVHVVKDQGALYYSGKDDTAHADPKLVRPFRVGMACGFCHVAPNPLLPPKDPEHPEWASLSGTIGNQYWMPHAIFTNVKGPNSFLWHYAASQQPGTIDTSLVSTDHINNPVVINPVFQLNPRLARAHVNPPEPQSLANMRMRGIEDAPLLEVNPRHVPRVLMDGADSIGIEGALSRVYLNIGSYSEEWRRTSNLIIGFKEQRPFELSTMQGKSVYWQATERFVMPRLEAYLTGAKGAVAVVTQPMKLDSLPKGRELIEKARERSASEAHGREVFLRNCAVCHSSKQPPKVALTFSDDWRSAPIGEALTLPMRFEDWEEFRASGQYRNYVDRMLAYEREESAKGTDFLVGNYLSTDVRVPVTLVGTNSQRAVGTNGMRGQVWDNFSSEAYKHLPAVGQIRFFNPFKEGGVDAWGNNDSYAPPGGGPGYYRPPTLVGIWATAPFLHNNALGIFNVDAKKHRYDIAPAAFGEDISLEGRIAKFDNAIEQLLNQDKRAGGSGRPGDLRATLREADGGYGGPIRDPGFIYRTTARSYIDFRAPFIRPLLEGVLGHPVVAFIDVWLWVVLVIGSLWLFFLGHPRHAACALAILAALAAALIRGSLLDTLYPWLWWYPAVALFLAVLLFVLVRARMFARLVFFGLMLVFMAAGLRTHYWISGAVGDMSIGPIPKGTPINLIMNIDREASLVDLFKAGSGLARGVLRIQHDKLGDARFEALAAFEREAGPALMRVSKCPDFVLDRGHWFGEHLGDGEKAALKAFLMTL